jgi:hypothetical protein
MMTIKYTVTHVPFGSKFGSSVLMDARNSEGFPEFVVMVGPADGVTSIITFSDPEAREDDREMLGDTPAASGMFGLDPQTTK